MSGHWVWCGDPEDSLAGGGSPEGTSFPLVVRRFDEVLSRLDAIAVQLDFFSTSQRSLEHVQRSLEHVVRHFHKDVSTSARATSHWRDTVGRKTGESANHQESLLQSRERFLAQRRLAHHAPGGPGISPSMPGAAAADMPVEEATFQANFPGRRREGRRGWAVQRPVVAPARKVREVFDVSPTPACPSLRPQEEGQPLAQPQQPSCEELDELEDLDEPEALEEPEQELEEQHEREEREERSLSDIAANLRRAPSKLSGGTLVEKGPELESPGSAHSKLSEGPPTPPTTSPSRKHLASPSSRRVGAEAEEVFVGRTKSSKSSAASEYSRGFWPRQELKDLGKNESQRTSISGFTAPQMTRGQTRLPAAAAGGTRFRTLHPDSWRLVVFDFLTFLILVYESFMIPYTFAWHLPFEGWLAVISWITFAVWAIDFLLGFVTGYHDKDKVVRDLPKVVKHYCKTFLLPNLLVLSLDLAANIVEMANWGKVGGQHYYSSIILARIIKLNRVMRVVKMLQTGKAAHVYDMIVTIMRQRGLAGEINLLGRIMKLVFFIVWANHLGCCFWHAVGSGALAEWCRGSGVEDSGHAFEYLLSFYWSSSSMVAGESVMVPTNSGEVAVTTFFVLIGFIFSSVLISSLLTAVIEYQDSNKERAEKVKTLRQFLYQHHVHSKLSVNIQNQVSDRIAATTRLSEKDVTALSLLSPVIRCELWRAIYGPSIADNAFIRTCSVLQDNFLKDLCFGALQHATHEPGDRVFGPNTQAVGPHFVYWGRLDYLPVAVAPIESTNSRSAFRHVGSRGKLLPASSSGLSGRSGLSLTDSLGVNLPENSGSPIGHKLGPQPVDSGNWVCHLALWVNWLHRGWLEAAVPCELLTVQAEPFVKLLANRPDLFAITRDYSAAVLGALEHESPHELSDISCNIEHVSLVSAMPLETRVHFSWAAASSLESKQWTGRLFAQDGYQELAAEIEAGECDLVLEPSDNVYRLVTIAALRLERQDGTILTQLGKCTKGQTIASCTFPGTKLHIGELPQDAVDRLMRIKLKPFAEIVSIRGRSVDVQEKVSKKYGVTSRYRRTLFVARMGEGAVESGIIPLGRKPLLCSTRSSSPCPSEKDLFLDYEAFAFAHEEGSDTKFIYAWLSPQDNQALTAPGGDALAQKWVSDLKTDILQGPISESGEA